MDNAVANLRISYLGGGYDFPDFFKKTPITILSEGIGIQISCTLIDNQAHWSIPPKLGKGLASSAAKTVSMIRARYPSASHKDQINTAIQLEKLQHGGWQDPIASGQQGVFLIKLFQNDWKLDRFKPGCVALLKKYRRLYEIPAGRKVQHSILTEMHCRETSLELMQKLVHQGAMALNRFDIIDFGRTVRAAWEIKKRWHPNITNSMITAMEKAAKDAGAYGEKVCGAGGQGYMLILGDTTCHKEISRKYKQFEVDVE